MPPTPRVTTVVVNYRHYDDTVRCLAALQASDYLNQRLVVVDNTEASDSAATLTDLLDPCVDVIAAGGNVGFAAGCNAGIRSALDHGADYVWLVNPDAVVAPEALSAMVAVAQAQSDAGVVGARILDGSGGDPPRILFNGGVIDATRKGSPSHSDAGKLDRDVPDGAVRDVDYVTGACFLIRRSLLRQIGFLPEEYFLYFEETDYCLQARTAGWRTVMAPNARVWHFKRSTARIPTAYYVYYMCRNRVLFSRRFFGADFSDCESDMGQLISGWRTRVETHTPALIERFDELVELAFTDAREGRTGRRDEVADFFGASTTGRRP